MYHIEWIPKHTVCGSRLTVFSQSDCPPIDCLLSVNGFLSPVVLSFAQQQEEEEEKNDERRKKVYMKSDQQATRFG